MKKTTEALKLAEEALLGSGYYDTTQQRKALAAIREALAEQALQNLSDFHQYMEATEPEYYDCGGTVGVVHKSQCSAAMKRNGKPWKCACGANLYIDSNGAPASKAEHKCSEHKCSEHPDAPHGFDRNASHNAGRYVCECEGWEPEDMAYRPNGLSMDAQDQYEVGTLEDADILKQRIQELEQQNAALKAVVDAWNNVEPVKQEPVVYYAYATIKEYEELAGFSVSQAFRAGWNMARTTNSMLGINAAPVQPVKQEPVAWINEDELPEHYPYEEMFNTSTIIDGVRMFPNVKMSARSMFYGLTKDHTWLSVTESQFNKLKPEKRMKCYLTPVDAKAIRAEALEEAAKWFEDEEHPLQPKKVAAAIRGLK